MIKVVADSSVLVKWLNQEGELNLDQADKLLLDVQEGRVELIAPELSKYEVGNALLKKGLIEVQAFQSLATVYSLPIQFIPETEELAGETYQMAYRVRLTEKIPKFTYYDASFSALAKQEGATLVTANPKHHTKIVGVKVLPLEKYK